MNTQEENSMPWWKAILITLGIVIAALVLIYGASLTGLHDLWIAFLALVIWGARGMKMEQAPGIFIGGAIGLLIAAGIEVMPEIYGEWAIIVPLAGLILAISSSIKGAFPLLFNFSTFAYMTIGSAGFVLEERLHWIYLPNLALGAILFWIIPWVVLKIRPGSKKT